jgi:hypothetical protein
MELVDHAVLDAWAGLMGVRRQGLEPRTVALRVLVRRFLDLRRWPGIGPDLGVGLPLLSATDQGLPIVRGPSAARLAIG